MEKKDFKIVFMGTPEFAVTILDKLIDEGNNVVGVITAPDKPAGRGQKIIQSAVKSFAVTNSLNILQPTNLKDESFVAELQALEADLFVVVAFRMLPEVVWQMPPMGTINLHASLLPQYRGAAPINWAVINGDKESGVSTFFIEKQIDTGEILEQAKVAISENDTAGELHDELMQVGAQLTAITVDKIRKGESTSTPQQEMLPENMKPAPKIFKPDCKLNLEKPIRDIHNFVRGMSPYPTAWMKWENLKSGGNKTIKIFKTLVHSEEPNEEIGLYSENKELFLRTLKGTLQIIELQMEGKRRVEAIDFLTGYNTEDWKIQID